MELKLYPDPILKQKCEPVKKVTPELKALAEEMYSFMRKNNGAGLAANQIGQTIRLLVIDDNGPVYMFNPKILQGKGRVCDTEECLSFPGEKKQVPRNIEIAVQYRDINNKNTFAKYSGFLSRVIQHEIDHLNGITFDEKEIK